MVRFKSRYVLLEVLADGGTLPAALTSTSGLLRVVRRMARDLYGSLGAATLCK